MLILNPALHMRPVHESGRLYWVAELDDAHGRTQRLRLNDETRRRIEQLDLDPGCDASDASRRLRELALRYRLWIRPDESLHAPAQQARPAYLAAMWPLLPSAVVNRIAPMLQWLYAWPLLACALLLIVWGQWRLLGLLAEPSLEIAPSPEAVLITALLSALAVLMHELGHAAAAYRCGARRVSIGVGWYVAFPVAYADLSESWAWSRRQRMLVDLAGVWLQGLVATLYVVLHRASGDGVFLAAATAVSASLAWNLNPLLRMDGYWLLADGLGVPNLRREAASALSSLWRSRAWPRSRPTWQWWMLTLYAGAATLFMGVMMFWAVRHLWRVLPALPEFWADRLSRLGHAMGPADTVVAVCGLLVQALLLFAALRLLYLPARRFLKRRSVPTD